MFSPLICLALFQVLPLDTPLQKKPQMFSQQDWKPNIQMTTMERQDSEGESAMCDLVGSTLLCALLNRDMQPDQNILPMQPLPMEKTIICCMEKMFHREYQFCNISFLFFFLSPPQSSVQTIIENSKSHSRIEIILSNMVFVLFQFLMPRVQYKTSGYTNVLN